MSDAVDRSIAQMDFTPLAGSTVFLDSKYIRQVKGAGFINSDYIVASLRRRIMTSGCVLEDRLDAADFVVEVRVGALGTDGHEITYGIPASQALNATANLVASGPIVPTIPEISLAKRDERRAEVKIAVFAYHRETKQPILQPGVVKGTSMAKSTWFLGAGPFEQGSIYESVQLAGLPIEVDALKERARELDQPAIGPLRLPQLPLPVFASKRSQQGTDSESEDEPVLTRLGQGTVVAHPADTATGSEVVPASAIAPAP